MLAMLGWNPGTPQEIFSMDELIEAFSLERVGKAGAKFDPNKTKWFNQQYLRAKSDSELGELIAPLAKEKGYDVSTEYLAEVSRLMKERASFLPEIVESGAYLFEMPQEYDEKTVRKKWKEDTPEVMESLMGDFEGLADWNAANCEAVFKDYLEKTELGMGRVLPNLRLLITGQGMGPSMFDIMALLGKEECLNRMKKGISELGSAAN